ncbi:MAG: glycosyltransferase family 4 protein [Patescibacteria group bacterium]|jgi:glycosyltransferase involved in cell wall biosynthesis
MKILILHRAPLWGSGSGTYVRKLAEELVKKDKVAIVCPDDHKLSKVKIFNVKTPFPGVFHNHPDYPMAKKYSEMTSLEFTKYLLPYLEETVKAVEDFKPDIIHVQHVSFLVWVADYIKIMYNIPFVVSVHGPDLNTALVDRRLKLLTKHSLTRASRIFPNSFDTKNRFYSLFGETFRRKTRTVFPGVDLGLYPLDRQITIVNKKYHLKDKKLVIFVGRLDKEKGIEFLIRAAKNIQAEVYVLGGGDYQKELEELAKELKIENVHFLGYFGKDYVKELREFYTRADVVVVPSTVREALGFVILEAMAAKTPVVASRIGGIPNVIKDGKTGFLVRPRSPKEIAEKVNKIINNDKLRLAMGKRCRKLIEERFTWEKAAGAMRDSYRQALKHVIKKQQEKAELDKLLSWLE